MLRLFMVLESFEHSLCVVRGLVGCGMFAGSGHNALLCSL